MLRIEQSPLPEEILDHLAKLQAEIDQLPTFAEKVKKAKSKWDSKSKIEFEKIKELLGEMTIDDGICNYCEQSEAGDIEHIWPKSFFPDRTFVWDNYLYVCKQCNTGEKLDQASVFDPPGGDTSVLLKRGTEPQTQDLCFIDPRQEDPLLYLELDFENFLFFPAEELTLRGKEKAIKTIDILGLNQRDILRRKRKRALNSFNMLLKQYVAARNALTHKELDNCIAGDPPVDFNLDLDVERQRILSALKTDILRQDHLTVFREMQRKVDQLHETVQSYFIEAPEALNW